MAIEVLVTIPFTEVQLQRLKDVSPALNFTVVPSQRSADIPSETWAHTEVLYTGHILPEPDQVPALKWIQFHFAGIDRYTGEALLNKPGLRVTTLSGAAAPQVAEHALAMLLALSRRLPALIQSQRKAEWPRDRFDRFSPLELNGRTVGIIGYGSIGREIARLLQPFGVTVLASKFNAMNPQDGGYMPDGLGDPRGELVRRLYPPQAVRSMLKECHYLVVTAPLTPQSRGMLNAKTLSALQPGACLVDVSRGGILVIDDLLEMLKNGHLGGAALDVFPEEPLPAAHPLWNAPGVIITPHISGSSLQYNERATALFAENLQRYVSDLPLYNLFDPSRGY